MLRRHWRTYGFDRPAPEQPIATSNTVFYLGLGLSGTFAINKLLEHTVPLVRTLAPYFPVFGGMFEFVLLYLVWLSLLEAKRTERPLRREPRLWIGFGIGILPPATEFLRALARF
jgi:hypothetical protein